MDACNGALRRKDLIDMLGRIIKTIDHIDTNTVTIDRENLPGGTYFISIQSSSPSLIKVMIG